MPFYQNVNTVLGLDIGSHTVKAVQLTKKDHFQPHLTSLSVAEIDGGNNNRRESVKAAVQSVLKPYNTKKIPIVSAVGGSSLVIKQIYFPSSSPKEIESALEWEAGRYIPLPTESVLLKFHIRGVSDDGKSSDLLLVAADKDLVHNHLDLLHDLDVEPKIVDAAPLALTNAYAALAADEEKKNLAIVEIGASTSHMIVYRKQGFFFYRDIPIAGNRFTEEIQRHYQYDYREAEQAKRGKKFGLEIVTPVLNQLLSEIRQSLLYYDTKTGNKGYDGLLLTGGGAKLPGLFNYLEKNLSMPILYFEPLEYVRIEDSIRQTHLHVAELQLCEAIGLALRG